jgi:hypothetical protein
MLNQKQQLLLKDEEATVVLTVAIPLCFAGSLKLIYPILAGIEPQTPVSQLPQTLCCNISFLSKAFCAIPFVDYTIDRVSTINILSFSFTVTRTTAKCQSMVQSRFGKWEFAVCLRINQSHLSRTKFCGSWNIKKLTLPRAQDSYLQSRSTCFKAFR